MAPRGKRHYIGSCPAALWAGTLFLNGNLWRRV
jgi:hypothetical protein